MYILGTAKAIAKLNACFSHAVNHNAATRVRSTINPLAHTISRIFEVPSGERIRMELINTTQVTVDDHLSTSFENALATRNTDPYTLDRDVRMALENVIGFVSRKLIN